MSTTQSWTKPNACFQLVEGNSTGHAHYAYQNNNTPSCGYARQSPSWANSTYERRTRDFSSNIRCKEDENDKRLRIPISEILALCRGENPRIGFQLLALGLWTFFTAQVSMDLSYDEGTYPAMLAFDTFDLSRRDTATIRPQIGISRLSIL